MAYPLAIIFVTAVALSAAVYFFEKWRLARPGGPYAAGDFSGIILLISAAAGWILWTSSPTGAPNREILLWTWAAALIVFLVGTITDQVKPFRGLRALAAIVAAYLLFRHGIAIETVKLPFSHTFVDLGTAGLILSMIWLAVCGSLFARVGTLPRVSTGVGLLTSLTFLAIGYLQPVNTSSFGIFITATLACICLAQLPFTRFLTYRGATAGAYTLGVMIGVISIVGALKNTAFLVALIPLMVFSVPIFAATYSWGADWLRGNRRGLFDRSHLHLHELLMQQGYSQTQMAAILLLGEAMMCVLALILVLLIEVTFIVKLILLLLGLTAALLLPYVALRLMRPANPPAPPDHYDLLGVRIDRVTMESAMERVSSFIREDTPHMIVTLDAIGIIRAQDDQEMLETINNADLVTADGAGVVLAARLLNLWIDTRVSGCDMVSEISRVAASMDRSVFLLGAAPGVAAKAAENLQRDIPGLNIAGVQDGYYDISTEPQLVQRIHDLKPAAIFVALGAPRQERFIISHMEEMGVPVCIGIGGSFDVISGLKQRAPVWMQRCGLEWLHRVIKEPSRIPRLAALPRIILLTFRELLRPPRSPQQAAGNDT